MNNTKYYPSTEAVDHAATVLSEILEPTPFMKNNNLSDIYDAEVYLKREDLQMVRHRGTPAIRDLRNTENG